MEWMDGGYLARTKMGDTFFKRSRRQGTGIMDALLVFVCGMLVISVSPSDAYAYTDNTFCRTDIKDNKVTSAAETISSIRHLLQSPNAGERSVDTNSTVSDTELSGGGNVLRRRLKAEMDRKNAQRFSTDGIGFEGALGKLGALVELLDIVRDEEYPNVFDTPMRDMGDRKLLLISGSFQGDDFGFDLIGPDNLLGNIGALGKKGLKLGLLGALTGGLPSVEAESEMQGVNRQYLLNYQRGPWNVQTGVQVGVMARDGVNDTFFLQQPQFDLQQPPGQDPQTTFNQAFMQAYNAAFPEGYSQGFAQGQLTSVPGTPVATLPPLSPSNPQGFNEGIQAGFLRGLQEGYTAGFQQARQVVAASVGGGAQSAQFQSASSPAPPAIPTLPEGLVGAPINSPALSSVPPPQTVNQPPPALANESAGSAPPVTAFDGPSSSQQLPTVEAFDHPRSNDSVRPEETGIVYIDPFFKVEQEPSEGSDVLSVNRSDGGAKEGPEPKVKAFAGPPQEEEVTNAGGETANLQGNKDDRRILGLRPLEAALTLAGCAIVVMTLSFFGLRTAVAMRRKRQGNGAKAPTQKEIRSAQARSAARLQEWKREQSNGRNQGLEEWKECEGGQGSNELGLVRQGSAYMKEPSMFDFNVHHPNQLWMHSSPRGESMQDVWSTSDVSEE